VAPAPVRPARIIEVDRHLANPDTAFSQCLRAFRPAFCPHFSKCDCSHRANELQTVPCFNLTVKMRLDNQPIAADAAKAAPSGCPGCLARRRHRPSPEQISSIGRSMLNVESWMFPLALDLDLALPFRTPRPLPPSPLGKASLRSAATYLGGPACLPAAMAAPPYRTYSGLIRAIKPYLAIRSPARMDRDNLPSNPVHPPRQPASSRVNPHFSRVTSRVRPQKTSMLTRGLTGSRVQPPGRRPPTANRTRCSTPNAEPRRRTAPCCAVAPSGLQSRQIPPNPAKSRIK